MNNYSISIYKPDKLISNIPFTINIVPSFLVHYSKITQEHKVTTYNTESSIDFCQKNLPSELIYFKPLIISLKDSRNNNEIGAIEAIFINTALLIKDNIKIYDLAMKSTNETECNFSKYLCIFSDENGEFINNENNNHLYIKSFYINKEYRNKGFGSYIIKNIADIVERIFGLSYSKIIIPWEIIVPLAEKKLMDSDDLMEKYIQENILKFQHLINNNQYTLLFEDIDENIVFYKNN